MRPFTPFPLLSTPRFQLRQFTTQDLPMVFAGLSNPEVIKYYGISFETLEATQEQLDWFNNLETTGTGIWWAICDKEQGTFVGAGGFHDINHVHKKAEVGFWLLPDFWRQGIMSEVMPCLLQFAFEELKLHRVEGFVDHQNQACKLALDRLNFNYEGTMRDCEVKDEAFLSVDIYACLSTITCTE